MYGLPTDAWFFIFEFCTPPPAHTGMASQDLTQSLMSSAFAAAQAAAASAHGTAPDASHHTDHEALPAATAEFLTSLQSGGSSSNAPAGGLFGAFPFPFPVDSTHSESVSQLYSQLTAEAEAASAATTCSAPTRSQYMPRFFAKDWHTTVSKPRRMNSRTAHLVIDKGARCRAQRSEWRRGWGGGGGVMWRGQQRGR